MDAKQSTSTSSETQASTPSVSPPEKATNTPSGEVRAPTSPESISSPVSPLQNVEKNPSPVAGGSVTGAATDSRILGVAPSLGGESDPAPGSPVPAGPVAPVVSDAAASAPASPASAAPDPASPVPAAPATPVVSPAAPDPASPAAGAASTGPAPSAAGATSATVSPATPNPSLGPQTVNLMPLPKLPLSDQKMEFLGSLKQRKGVTTSYHNGDYTFNTPRDLYYEKTLLNLSLALHDLRAFRKQQENQVSLKNPQSPSSSASVSSRESLGIDIHSKNPLSKPGEIDRSSLSSRESLSVHIKDKPKCVKIEGGRVDFVKGLDVSHFFQKTGEPISDALAKLAEFLILLFQNRYIHVQSTSIQRQLNDIRKELKILKAMDDKNGTNLYEQAKNQLDPELLDLIDSKKTLEQKRLEFYKKPEIAELLKSDNALALSDLSVDEVKILKNAMAPSQIKKIQDIDPDKTDYKTISFTSSEISSIREVLSKNNDPQAQSLSSKIVLPSNKASVEISTHFSSDELNAIVLSHGGYRELNTNQKNPLEEQTNLATKPKSQGLFPTYVIPVSNRLNSRVNNAKQVHSP